MRLHIGSGQMEGVDVNAEFLLPRRAGQFGDLVDFFDDRVGHGKTAG